MEEVDVSKCFDMVDGSLELVEFVGHISIRENIGKHALLLGRGDAIDHFVEGIGNSNGDIIAYPTILGCIIKGTANDIYGITFASPISAFILEVVPSSIIESHILWANIGHEARFFHPRSGILVISRWTHMPTAILTCMIHLASCTNFVYIPC